MNRIIEFLRRRWLALASRGNIAILRLRGVEVGKGCRIHRGVFVEFHHWLNGQKAELRIGAQVEIDRGVTLSCFGGRIDIGDFVYIGPQTMIYGHGGVTIGAESLLAMGCRLVSGNHAIPPSGTEIRSMPDTRKPIVIGRDVWLGANVIVLAGVCVGDGCVVGAGAVVTKDLPPNTIAVGSPARVIRRRGES